MNFIIEVVVKDRFHYISVGHPNSCWLCHSTIARSIHIISSFVEPSLRVDMQRQCYDTVTPQPPDRFASSSFCGTVLVHVSAAAMFVFLHFEPFRAFSSGLHIFADIGTPQPLDRSAPFQVLFDPASWLVDAHGHGHWPTGPCLSFPIDHSIFCGHCNSKIAGPIRSISSFMQPPWFAFTIQWVSGGLLSP